MRAYDDARAYDPDNPPPGFRHGNTASYRRGCRCNKCRAAVTRYSREVNRKKVAVYDADGYDENGIDRDGYGDDGYHHHTGRNHEGYDRDGYDVDGFGYDGFNVNGRDRDGNRRRFFSTYNATG